MNYRIIERNLGGFIVEYRKCVFTKWRSISDPEEVYKASMKGYFGPIRSKIFHNVPAATEAIKEHKSLVTKKSRVVWEE